MDCCSTSRETLRTSPHPRLGARIGTPVLHTWAGPDHIHTSWHRARRGLARCRWRWVREAGSSSVGCSRGCSGPLLESAERASCRSLSLGEQSISRRRAFATGSCRLNVMGRLRQARLRTSRSRFCRVQPSGRILNHACRIGRSRVTFRWKVYREHGPHVQNDGCDRGVHCAASLHVFPPAFIATPLRLLANATQHDIPPLGSLHQRRQRLRCPRDGGTDHGCPGPPSLRHCGAPCSHRTFARAQPSVAHGLGGHDTSVNNSTSRRIFLYRRNARASF